MPSFAVTAASAYLGLAQSLASKSLSFTADPVKCMLMASYVPSPGTHRFRSHALAAGTEASGAGYAVGGATLTSVSWSSSSGGAWSLSAVIPPWDTTGGTLSATHAVFYGAASSDPAAQPLICYWELRQGSAVVSSDGLFQVYVGPSGIIRFPLA